MTDHALHFTTDLKGLEPDDWLAALEEVVEENGSFTPLGPDHVATFLDAGPQLLVTFENAADIRALPDAAPRGFAFARREGWSHLAIIGREESWFRDPAIYRHVDRLIDDGFFEDFESVLFFGSGAGGYAAAAYSVAAPGARVLALRPQATLDPTVTGWDTRYMAQRRLNFTGRYAYAPDMIDAARQVWIAYAPQQRFDAMHASLFTRPNVQMLRISGIVGRLDAAFDSLGALDTLLRDAMAGDLTVQRFIRALAARKTYSPYLRNLVRRARDRGHDDLAALACRAVLARGPDSHFARQLEQMGQPVPQQDAAE
ncbi:hypothetical protein SAMN05444339_101869 [Loktanella atrilutea]|uniref:Phosphoadenosine phosphosulfate reductase n=1 Tax=Loktanella atrilutea TaxID=366533 RepID=A0A1M4UWA8_LOKAT|nr:hypothetical protein [Loktanella atrilutea]SHE60975.1 hypothetical protein SAMN05444339_101869 [Loktanella atrilutea]